MKIFLYLRQFPSAGQPLIDGTAKAVAGLAGGLAQAGADVTVLCEGPVSMTTRTGHGYVIRSFRQRLRVPFAVAVPLVRFLRSGPQRPDLVVLNGMFHPSVAVLAWLCRRFRIPYVVAPHDPYHPRIFSKKALRKWGYWRLIERRVLKKAAAIQVLDSRHVRFLNIRDIKNRTLTVANGFDPADARVDTIGRVLVDVDGRMQRGTDEIRVIFLGRMDSENKGLDILLEAWSTLMKGKCDAVRLHVQGRDSGDRERLAKLAEARGISESVSFAGLDASRSPVDIISQHDILCLPSRWEGFGLVALEAMLAERVVLVSEGAGIAPHIEASGCGVLVQPEVASIVSGLRTLLDRRNRWQEMGASGRSYALANLNWEALGRHALAGYRDILQEASVPARRPERSCAVRWRAGSFALGLWQLVRCAMCAPGSIGGRLPVYGRPGNVLTASPREPRSWRVSSTACA